MDAVAPFSFNPANTFSDSFNSLFNPLAMLNNVKQLPYYQSDETASKSWMSQTAIEDGQQRMIMSGLGVSPVLGSRSISGENTKNALAQFLPLQLAPPVLPPQLSALTASAFASMPFPLVPSTLNRSCSLEYPGPVSSADIPVPVALTLSPSSSVDTSAVNSPNPALLSAAVSVAESESDEEEFKVKCERQIEADRQHNRLSAVALASELGCSSFSSQSENAPAEEKVRRGRRRKGDAQSDESQERRRRRRLDSHMRYDRHRREVLQGIFTDLRALVFSANEVAESSNQTLQACKLAVKAENGASASGVNESTDASIFLRNFSREDLEKLSVCDLLAVTHRCLRSLNQLKSKLENRIQQMDTETENSESEHSMEQGVKKEEGDNNSSPAVAVDTDKADPVLSSLFYHPIGFTMYTRLD